jgi:hypothetical protein
LYEIYSLRHPSCHQLWSEQLEVEGMDMVEEQDHPMNHRLGVEGMNMVGSNMVEVDGIDTVEEHFHPMNDGPELEGMDTVDTGMRMIEQLSWRLLKDSPRAWCW